MPTWLRSEGNAVYTPTVLLPRDCVRTIIETLAYLSLNIVTKKILASKQNGKWLRDILAFGSSEDKVTTASLSIVPRGLWLTRTHAVQSPAVGPLRGH